MAKRHFRAEDANRLKALSDPNLSPDARRVAFVMAEVDEEKDRLSSAIWVAACDGSTAPRRFSEGPADRSPRWSPDGRWLAYLSTPDGKPNGAHVRLAPLDGGAAVRLGDLPGPISQLAWSPDSSRMAVIGLVGGPDPDSASAQERNAARLVRGLAARFDGVGWREGRRHLFVVDVDGGSATQLTRGQFDHADPSFSPDGSSIAFVSDRHARRDDRQLRGDVFVVAASGGRPRRVTNGGGRAFSPSFSPDGSMIAFAGQLGDSWDRDSHVFVVPADGSKAPRQVAPATDRPVPAAPVLPPPHRWSSNEQLAMLVTDRGRVHLHLARLDRPRSRAVVSGDTQLDGFSLQGDVVAFSSSWPDRPSEVFTATIGRDPAPLTHLNEDFVNEVALAEVGEKVITRPDGTEIGYFTLLSPGRTPRRLPLHLDIHGGPHGYWPSGRFLALHQAIAAAGYAVVLPNPRGSTGYGQDFTSACTGDWGGADYEDVLACCDDLVSRGVADGGRMFVSGGSYGGFLTAWIVGHDHRFKAATAVAAVIDMTSMISTDVPEFVVFAMGGTPWEQAAEYEKRSPLSYLEHVTTPVLVLHWEGDLRVPIGQGEQLYAGLRLLGKKSALVRYPGGFHVLRTPSQAVDWAKQLLDWNAAHDPRSAPRATARRQAAKAAKT